MVPGNNPFCRAAHIQCALSVGSDSASLPRWPLLRPGVHDLEAASSLNGSRCWEASPALHCGCCGLSATRFTNSCATPALSTTLPQALVQLPLPTRKVRIGG